MLPRNDLEDTAVGVNIVFTQFAKIDRFLRIKSRN